MAKVPSRNYFDFKFLRMYHIVASSVSDAAAAIAAASACFHYGSFHLRKSRRLSVVLSVRPSVNCNRRPYIVYNNLLAIDFHWSLKCIQLKTEMGWIGLYSYYKVQRVYIVNSADNGALRKQLMHGDRGGGRFGEA